MLFARLNNSVVLVLISLIFVVFTSIPALAEIEVVRGQYVIKTAPVAAAHSGDGPASLLPAEVAVFEELSAHTLVGPAVAAASSDSTSPYEEFDPDKHLSWCDDLMASAPHVTACEPNYVYRTSALPNDSRYNDLWGMSQIGASQAWDLATGSTEVVVAVIDTGVDYTHPDLAANMWENPDEIPGNGIDDDGNGFVDDVYGANTLTNSGDPYDDNMHGTHVAGTIGAAGNNSAGVVGVNWTVKLMGVKFLSASGSGSLLHAIKAIDYAVAEGADVINASWGGRGYSSLLEDAVARAEAAGILFVAAAGNSALNNDTFPHYPSNFDLANVVSVAATDSRDKLAYFSNYGTSVHIAAPGMSILSTLPGARYGNLSGTSMAAPHVAGLAALVKAFHPDYSHYQIKDTILNGGTLLGSLSEKVGTGRRIHALGALTSTPGEGGGSAPKLPATVSSILGKKSARWVNNRVFLRKPMRFTVVGTGSTDLTLTFSGPGIEAFQCSIPNQYVAGSQRYQTQLVLRGATAFAKHMSISTTGDGSTQAKSVRIKNRRASLERLRKRFKRASKVSAKTLEVQAQRSCERINRKLRLK